MVVLVAVAGPYRRKPLPAVVVQAEEFANTEPVVIRPLTTHAVHTPLFRPRIDPMRATV